MNSHSENEPAPQKLKERLRQVANETILGAAEKLFAQRGVHAARMEEIASEAGVSVGTLYNHFRDREALFSSLCDERRTELVARIDVALADRADAPFVDQLRGFISALSEHFDAHQPFVMILMEGEHCRDAKTFPVAVAQPRLTMSNIYERLEELIRRGVKQRALRAEDASIYPTMLLGMLRGSVIRRLYDPEPKPLTAPERVEQMVRFFLQGAGA